MLDKSQIILQIENILVEDVSENKMISSKKIAEKIYNLVIENTVSVKDFLSGFNTK